MPLIAPARDFESRTSATYPYTYQPSPGKSTRFFRNSWDWLKVFGFHGNPSTDTTWGLETALARKPPTGRQYRKLDGAQEAQLIALACGAPPEGRIRWTFQLLADKAVALAIVDRISTECVRTTLKKMRSSPGSSNSG